MRGWWRDLTDLVLPAECGGCGRPRTALCTRCRAALYGAAPRRARPVPEPTGLPVVYAAAAYEDEARAIVLGHKERGVLGLAAPLGCALAAAVRAGLGAEPERAGPVTLVPVPSARAAVRARGHDPARRITLRAAGELRRAGVAARVLSVLRQRRAVADQAGLDARQRQANLSGALEVAAGGRRLLGGGRIVVVDDVMTTGASLAEAARALRAAFTEQEVGGGERRCGDSARQVGPGAYGEVTGCTTGDGTVEAAALWEGRTEANPPTVGVNGLGPVIGAAVVAAPPDSFEINRN